MGSILNKKDQMCFARKTDQPSKKFKSSKKHQVYWPIERLLSFLFPSKLKVYPLNQYSSHFLKKSIFLTSVCSDLMFMAPFVESYRQERSKVGLSTTSEINTYPNYLIAYTRPTVMNAISCLVCRFRLCASIIQYLTSVC